MLAHRAVTQIPRGLIPTSVQKPAKFFPCHTSIISRATDYPTRIVILSERSEPKDLSSILSNSFVCHTSTISRATPLFATDPQTRSRKPFACHTCDTPLLPIRERLWRRGPFTPLLLCVLCQSQLCDLCDKNPRFQIAPGSRQFELGRLRTRITGHAPRRPKCGDSYLFLQSRPPYSFDFQPSTLDLCPPGVDFPPSTLLTWQAATQPVLPSSLALMTYNLGLSTVRV